MLTETGTESGALLYRKIAEKIRRSIAEGDLRPGQLIGSEHALARESSISRMTIRRASQLLMEEGLLERRPGKGLFVKQRDGTPLTQQGGVIQLVAANLQWEPSLLVSRGILSVAKHEGIQLQLCDVHGNIDFGVQTLRELPKRDVKGAVIISLHSAPFNEAIYQLKVEGFPLVLIDGRLHDIDVPSVMSDNYSGGLQAAAVLLKHGHRRVGFIGDLVARTVQDRLMGLRDALGDAGMVFDRSLVVDLSSEQDRLGDWSGRIEAGARDLMSRPKPPTGIFCSCDAVARSVYRALGSLGLSVPGDVSVVGFDDDPLAEWLTPALTTVRQPFDEIGAVAARVLCKRMLSPDAPVEQHLLPVHLVERASVAAPR